MTFYCRIFLFFSFSIPNLAARDKLRAKFLSCVLFLCVKNSSKAAPPKKGFAWRSLDLRVKMMGVLGIFMEIHYLLFFFNGFSLSPCPVPHRGRVSTRHQGYSGNGFPILVSPKKQKNPQKKSKPNDFGCKTKRFWVQKSPSQTNFYNFGSSALLWPRLSCDTINLLPLFMF